MSLYVKRREKFMSKMANGSLAIFASAPPIERIGGFGHTYRQDSDFHYLTGFDEPNAICVLSPYNDGHKYILFVPPKDPKEEIWSGRRAGIEGAKERYGADEAYSIYELDPKLTSYLEQNQRLYYSLGRNSELDHRLISKLSNLRLRYTPTIVPSEIAEPGVILNEMRLIKCDEELSFLKKAAKVTQKSYEEIMHIIHPGVYEYEVEAYLINVFGKAGGKQGYTPIVASGPNALVLHYDQNKRQTVDGDLLLIDAGASIEYYSVDVTRTWPVNGRFNPFQKEIYNLVLKALENSASLIRPGVPFNEFHDKAVRTLTEGLISLGILKGSADELIEKKEYTKYYMHRTGHWLGMDIHDVGDYYVDGKPRPLECGMVLTAEPGLYIPENCEGIDPNFCGIGVRIEDNFVVTEDGNINITQDIPKKIEDIEERMAAKKSLQ